MVATPIYQLGEPLPRAVTGTRTTISPGARKEIELLQRRDPIRFLLQLTTAWALIVAAACLAEYSGSLWGTLLAILFIPTRQNILALLVHEQCHRLAFRSKLGDLFCNFAIAYPMLVTLEGYRRVHIAHHQNYFTDRDPDYCRKQGVEWTFPQRLARFAWLMLKDLSGWSLWKNIKSKNVSGGPKATPGSRSRRCARLAFYLSLAGFLTWTGLWPMFLLYWLLPLATVFQLIVRWGAICEHKYNLVNPDIVESTPIIEPRWWERIVLPNLNFTLHVYHHWFPRVPYAKLPRVHSIFRREGLVNHESVFHGYVEYLCYLLSWGKYRSSAVGVTPQGPSATTWYATPPGKANMETR